jgi:hypothetical protein
MYDISVYDKNIFLFILKSKLDECIEDYFRTICRDHVRISADLNRATARVLIILSMYDISVYDKNIFLIILKSKLDECGEDYFRTICRDHVRISADLKLRYGQSINYFYSSSKYNHITRSSF